MLKECNIYYYMGLYLNENEFKELGFQKANGLEVIIELQKYDTVYGLENEIHEINKQAFMEAIANMDSKYHEFCYQIRNGCFVLLPLEVLYGISNANDELIACYDDKTLRDAKLSLARKNGVLSLTEDMSKSNKQTAAFNEQQKIRKIYKSLTMTVD